MAYINATSDSALASIEENVTTNMKWILFQKKTYKVIDLPIEPQSVFFVGRNKSCALALGSNKVSKEHGYFLRGQKGVYIQDMGTLNGTYVNRKRLAPLVLTELKDKDEISFGLKHVGLAENEKDKLVFFSLGYVATEVESDLESGCTQVVNLDSAQLFDEPCSSGIATSTAIEGSNSNMAATVRDMIQVSTSISSLNAGSSRLAEHERDNDANRGLKREPLPSGEHIDLTTPSDDGHSPAFELKQGYSDEEAPDNNVSSSSKRIHRKEDTHEGPKRQRKSSNVSIANNNATYSVSRKNTVENTAENRSKNFNTSPILHRHSKSKASSEQLADKKRKSDITNSKASGEKNKTVNNSLIFEENQKAEKTLIEENKISSIPKRRHSKEESHESSKKLRKTLHSSTASNSHTNRRHSIENTENTSKKIRKSVDSRDKRSSLDEKGSRSTKTNSKSEHKKTSSDEKQQDTNKTKDKQSRDAPMSSKDRLLDADSTQKKTDKGKKIGGDKKKEHSVTKRRSTDDEKKKPLSSRKKKVLDNDKHETTSKRKTTTKEKDKRVLGQERCDLNKNLVNETVENKEPEKNILIKENVRKESRRNSENYMVGSAIEISVVREKSLEYDKQLVIERNETIGSEQMKSVDDVEVKPEVLPVYIVELLSDDDDDIFTNSPPVNSTPVHQIKIEKETMLRTKLEEDSVEISDDDDLFTNSQLVNFIPTNVEEIKLEMQAIGLEECSGPFDDEDNNSYNEFENTQEIADILEDGINTNTEPPPIIDPLPDAHRPTDVSPPPNDDSFGELSMILRNAEGSHLSKNDGVSFSPRKLMSTVPRSTSSLHKLTKEQIKEERRKKLKDLTQKPKKELVIELKQRTVPKTLLASKTNRGEFLLEEPKTANRRSRSRCKSVSLEPLEGSANRRSRSRCKSVAPEPLEGTAYRRSRSRCKSVALEPLEGFQNSTPERQTIQSRYPLRSKTPTPAQERMTNAPVAQTDRRTTRLISPRKNRSKSLGSARSKSPVLPSDRTSTQRGPGRPPSRYNNDPRRCKTPVPSTSKIGLVETFTTPLAELNESFDIHPKYNFRQRPNTPCKPATAQIKPNIMSPHEFLLQYENEDIMYSQNYDQSLMDGAGNNQIQEQKVAPVLPDIRKIDINDIMKLMLSWESKWLSDDNEFKGDPPLTPAARKVPKTFENMREYENTFNPLLLREIWAQCYQKYRVSEINPTAIHITHCRYYNGIVTLDCLSYISDKANQQNEPCMFDDLMLVEHINKNEYGAKLKSICFAYVTRVYRRRIGPKDNIIQKLAANSTSCDYAVEFTMILNHRPGREMAPVSYALIKPLMNIGVYIKMFKAIKNVRKSPLAAQIVVPMISMFKVTTFEDQLVCPLLGDALNPEQLQCVLEGASVCTRQSSGIFCMQGPPGTGKTTVIINMVMQILYGSSGRQIDHKVPKEPKILLVAPSNTAVDNILVKLVEAKELVGPGFIKNEIKQIRIGRERVINGQVQKYSLENVAKAELQQRDVVRIHPKYHEAVQKNTLGDLVKKVYGSRYDQELRKVQDACLAKSNVVCTTLSSCVIQKLTDLVFRNKLEFSCCIIDEATQCHEIESLLPTLLGVHKFVLVGDPKQLHATVLHKESQLMGFNQSLFARIEKNFSGDPRSPIRMLKTQYRMHAEICKFPNKMFYEGKLRSEPRVAHKIPANIRPYLVFNIDNQSSKPTSPRDSYVNEEEVHLIQMMLTTLFEMVDLSHIYTVGIITPYNGQKNLICQSIEDYLRRNPNIKVTVNTVDSFQGMEKDIVIISCVRHASNGFLQNVNRLNVALTRAKQALYIIGNYSLFKECKPLYDLREDAKRRKLLLDIKHDPTIISNFKKYIVR